MQHAREGVGFGDRAVCDGGELAFLVGDEEYKKVVLGNGGFEILTGEGCRLGGRGFARGHLISIPQGG